jgi:hypothetical protein
VASASPSSTGGCVRACVGCTAAATEA